MMPLTKLRKYRPMPQLDITLHGRRYNVACADGEELRLRQIADYLDGRISKLSRGVGNVGEARLFMLTCLMLADELAEVSGKKARGENVAAGASEVNGISEADTKAMQERITKLQQRLANITEKVAV